MFSLFILSLLGLCAAAIATFIITFRRHSFLLLVFVPLIAVCGSFIYFSYISVLGYPVSMKWEEMPKEITVIFFRVANNESIVLWLFDGSKTRLVELPYAKPAEDGLEAEREKMGEGTPVTFKTKSKGKGQKGEGEPGEGEGEGMQGDGQPGDQKEAKQGRPGWRYKVESYGDPNSGGKLPPK